MAGESIRGENTHSDTIKELLNSKHFLGSVSELGEYLLTEEEPENRFKLMIPNEKKKYLEPQFHIPLSITNKIIHTKRKVMRKSEVYRNMRSNIDHYLFYSCEYKMQYSF